MAEYPKRRLAVLGYYVGKEKVRLPVEITCYFNGNCHIRPPKMRDAVFPEKIMEKVLFPNKGMKDTLFPKKEKRED